MYKETITYEDFDGKTRTEDFLFNLTKAELIEMELGQDGGFTALLDRIIKANNTPDIIREIKRLLLVSYGVKSDDGRYFRKSPEITAAFENSEPYSIMFLKLIGDDEAAANFVNNVIPKEVAEQVAKEAAAGNIPQLAPPTT